jgi:hypothetical protein
MKKTLLNRVGRIEVAMPVVCPACGAPESGGPRTHTMLFELDGRLLRGDGEPVPESDLEPCRKCGRPRVRPDKVISGVDPRVLC